MQLRLVASAALIMLALPLSSGALVGPVTEPALDGAGCVPAATCTVVMTDEIGLVFRYDPPVLVVPAGTSVTFYADGKLHTATAGLITEAETAEAFIPGMNAFDTGLVQPGSDASVTFSAPGVYPYYCKVSGHRVQGMHGVIVVS